jgi:hypothetical protein
MSWFANVIRQAPIQRGCGSGKLGGDKFALSRECFQGIESVAVVGKGFVQFADEGSHLGNEFDEAFRDQNCAEFFTICCAVGDCFGNLVHDLLQCEPALGDFFGDERDVRVRSAQGAFQRDVRGRAAHELDKMPVFAGGDGVALDVANEIGVNLARCVETEAGLDVLAAQVAINRLGNAYHAERSVLGLGKLGKFRRIRIRVVATDHHQRGEATGFCGFECLEEILLRFELGAAGPDDVEAAGVAVAREEVGVDLDAFVFQKAVWAVQEADERAFGMDAFDGVEESGDDIVTAGSRTSGEDYTDTDRGGLGFR